MFTLKAFFCRYGKFVCIGAAVCAAFGLMAGQAQAGDRTTAAEEHLQPVQTEQSVRTLPRETVTHMALYYLDDAPAAAEEAGDEQVQELPPEETTEKEDEAAEEPEPMPEEYEEYIWPVSGVISSGFGYRDIDVGSSYHKGIDIAADGGEPIVASKAGQVEYSQYNDGGYGYLVILNHDDGTSTYYAHCSELLASRGSGWSRGRP
ncbi:MAG: M23 family metallopeptidase [Oscillospiraceae bacterium]|nr:M23 family metallopeptidase [Oscillospiraceae bacterium]